MTRREMRVWFSTTSLEDDREHGADRPPWLLSYAEDAEGGGRRMETNGRGRNPGKEPRGTGSQGRKIAGRRVTCIRRLTAAGREEACFALRLSLIPPSIQTTAEMAATLDEWRRARTASHYASSPTQNSGAVHSILRLLSVCCPCPCPADSEDDYIYRVSALLASPPRLSRALIKTTSISYSAGPPVVTQKLNERLCPIMRAKEGKMANVSACTAFVMQRVPSAPPSLSASSAATSDSPTPGHESAPASRTSRRPPVLTMTPARASLYHHAESRYSSPAGSRSSSRRRPEPAYAYGVRAKQVSTASEWFGESASVPESEVEVYDSAFAAGADPGNPKSNSGGCS
ncbi:hypothetical protein FB451DRAFT_1176711 [Mycena latifolia]|nr:hypothetical protein FB451DRAFT_1176711 [Mycena latifolia]